MFIGIDVGGTYTDAVLTNGKNVLKHDKTPTLHDNLIQSLLSALDTVICDIDRHSINRVVLSTTLVTNVIAEKKYPPVALVLMPGPGLSYSEYQYDTLTHIVKGAIDYRGREITAPDEEQLAETAAKLTAAGYRHTAIIGKFSNRNNTHELLAKQILQNNLPDFSIELGHTVSGQLNFPRRISTTMLTTATREVFTDFCHSVMKALKERGITAPAFILKADGGTLPLVSALDRPVETIFSGPAASTLGAMSLTPRGQTSVVVDIGGTTTDLSLILSGEPLMANKGAQIDSFLTHVRSFSVKSIPLGGDSTVVLKDGRLDILPERRGPAYCLGGNELTPTDALRYLDLIDFGDQTKAKTAIEKMAAEAGTDPDQVAHSIVYKAQQTIVEAIKQMFTHWEQEPAYRVWEVMQPLNVRPDNIVGVGGAAFGLIPGVAEQMGCKPVLPAFAEVANALGAAVAQPTLTLSIRIDTERGTYTVLENGTMGTISKGKNFSEQDALNLAQECLIKMADSLGISAYVKSTEVVYSEVFNMVRGWSTTGRIYDVCLQTPQNILFYLGQEG